MIGQLLDGRYKILQALSTGSFGHTYIAEDTRIPGNPQCVVKHLKPATNNANILTTAERLFWSEAESLAQLGNHDQIPRILDFLEENHEFFLVQEFVDGHPLTEELIPEVKLSESYVIALLQSVLPVLEFIHQRNVIHRDIKPGNIIRRKHDGKLVLIDFGAVKQVRVFATQIQDQQSSAILSIGTPGYMATEQVRGRPRPNSDIYALGIIAIQALTGKLPNELEEDLQTEEIVWEHHAPVSPELAKVITKMVCYNFKDRYQSATEVLLALHELENAACDPTLQMARAAAVNIPVRELTLEWLEDGQRKTHIIRDRQISKNPGTVRLGRNPVKCDIVLSEPTVSGLHAEIFFNRQQQRFYLRNLGQTNPAVVDGQSLSSNEVELHQGSSIQLGKLNVRVAAMTLDRVAESSSVPQHSSDANPTEFVVQEQSAPPQSFTPTVLPPPIPNTKLLSIPSVLPTPPVGYKRRRSVWYSPTKVFLRLGLGVVVGGSAIAAFTYLRSTPKPKPTPNPTITRQCEAVITANDNLRTEPNSANNNNIVKEYSQLPIEQKLPITGKKALVQNGGYWLELELPKGDLAYAHNTIIKNYSEIESCLKAQGKTFEQVNAAGLISTSSVAKSNPASFFDNNTIQSELTPNKTTTKSTPASFFDDLKIESDSTLKPSAISTPALNSRKPSKKPKPLIQPLPQTNLPPDGGPKILSQAREKAAVGDFREAINTAHEIHASSSAYREAVGAIAKWQTLLQKKGECMVVGGVWIKTQCLVLTPEPTPQSTQQPTPQPTPQSTQQPTPQPTQQPTPQPTQQPTPQSTQQPTPQSTQQSTQQLAQSYICWCSSNPTNSFESQENVQGKVCHSDGDGQPDGLFECKQQS